MMLSDDIIPSFINFVELWHFADIHFLSSVIILNILPCHKSMNHIEYVIYLLYIVEDILLHRYTLTYLNHCDMKFMRGNNS